MVDRTLLHADETIPLLQGALRLPVPFVLENAYLRPGDGAFIGGSLIEGIGNAYSDIDVHVITERLRQGHEIDVRRHYRVLTPDRSILKGSDPASEVFLIHTVVPGTHVKVDIEYRTLSEVEALARELGETFAYATRSLMLLTKYLGVRDMAFVHRLFHARDLAGGEYLADLRARIGLVRFQYLLYRWKASDFSVLLDILGAWDEGDLVRCADLARENMVAQFQAYTHLCGNTNYHRKWIIKSAQRCATEPKLLARYLRLLSAGFGLSASEIKEYILALMDFVDDIFAAGAHRLGAYAEVPSGMAACSAIDELMEKGDGEYSDMEIDYRKKAYGARTPATRALFR
ncbi:hypothetical protein [Ramlibacter tataouinensis]|uniref:Uncharacterized protein n=1 Tax=Ramlibacter tataouinensis (strain ATCC BAA-407 / DSM 14655 / LMG 21543 / TTB310) TaxID=365046 RepID=F5XXB5_RAMTT|nr:hypothetical protein [Ramlibacter tataouinensis]AEG94250.1 hypothetical protein Rta_31400 [Ramlibacter tataouinensis TTB310]